MTPNIINLEINEVSPILLEKYINDNKKSYLAKLRKQNKLNIFTTKASDIEKEKLYPSQTWASFNTGKKYSDHRCYWYSDNIKIEDLLWNKLAHNNISVGVLGSLHSSKYSPDLFVNKNFKFYLPDCFSNKDFAKPKNYKNFQALNNALVGESSRVTGLYPLLKTSIKYFLNIIFFPRRFGISLFSLKMIFSIIHKSIIFKNKEFLRMAQFPLIASIFCDLLIKYQPKYSSLFSNHVAGNMHRYWYAYDLNAFKNKYKYTKKWIKNNKKSIYLGLDFVDNYLSFILKKKELKNSIILITSSMGQEANPKFDSQFISKYDGKINNLKLFLNRLSHFQKKFYGESVEFSCSRIISQSIYNFVSSLGLVCKVDEEDGSIVLSIDPYTDLNFQKKYNMNKANKTFREYGFKFFPINDHHSGSHCEDGSLVLINANDQMNNYVKKYVENEGHINYLNFYNLITNFFKI